MNILLDTFYRIYLYYILSFTINQVNLMFFYLFFECLRIYCSQHNKNASYVLILTYKRRYFKYYFNKFSSFLEYPDIEVSILLFK